MATIIETRKGWLLEDLDGWSPKSRIETEVKPGSFVQLGFQYDIASVLVSADKSSCEVVVNPGFKPLVVKTSGIVSEILMLESKRSKIRVFELKGLNASTQIIGPQEEILIIRNERR